MSKSNPFASFADAAEADPAPAVVGPASVSAAGKKLTVQELADFLNMLLKNNPDLATAPVFQSEGMRIFAATSAEVDERRVIIG